MPSTLCASAPGSVMLFGEHAVLHGRHAIVAAVEQRVRVTLAPRADRRVVLRSALASAETELARLEVPHALRFVGGAIAARRATLAQGFALDIESAIDPTRGFGSSAAVTVATLAALAQWRDGAVDPAQLLDQGVAVIRAVQGSGSGADAAASVHGGLVLYRAEPRAAQRLPHAPHLTAVYSGGKVATPEVIAQVERRRRAQPRVHDALFDAIEACTLAAAEAIERADWAAVGALMDVAQGLMVALRVSTPRLDAIVQELRAQPGVPGAKISGAGLGDCAIALGEVADRALAPIRIDVATQGVRVDAR